MQDRIGVRQKGRIIMAVSKKPSPTIGVDKYTIFPLTTDGETPEYGTPTAIEGLVEITPTDNGGSATFDADNGAYDVVSYIEKMGHELTNADITPEIEALMRGLELSDGLITIKNDAGAPYFAVAWRVMKANGGYRYIRYYKGVYSFASNVGGKTKPSDGAPEFQTAKATFTAVQNANGEYLSYIDDDSLPQGVTKATLLSKWFTDPTWKPSATA